ncbi:MAG: tRNA epoxyqueuosine(34) reductase QueG [Kangiellaceae bacterium]|nr:tRNA epoxyqueuosine(34) reductase QueG [Kangiellaceae bacterium]MCW8998158.1 tRNA epoxyqueuosine(34) reductase QueG [Kangiellaceae bacterium]MCW9015638.1 tRNA epoxyqueuosine(34) reductase QueG [Kangiellaceae bacterium]
MDLSQQHLIEIKKELQSCALKCGFQDLRISDIQTKGYFERFTQWVKEGKHGNMSFLERNQNLRQFPNELHPDTCRILTVRLNYLPPNAKFNTPLSDPAKANVSRYALGKDYHKLFRKRLNHLISCAQEKINNLGTLKFRVFVDSAPVLETAFAEKSGVGWKGKHTLIINENAGSWFFLGEIFINLPLPIDAPVEAKCGNCNACISLCPTDAIIEDKQVDARKCISYLTIENKGEIPVELRDKIGNRIYGCDDCQLACPWNRFSQVSQSNDFLPKHRLDNIDLIELWSWNEQEFLKNFEGSPIRRIGFQSWLRNLAVAIGNSNLGISVIEHLEQKKTLANSLVNEHIDWAINKIQKNPKSDRSDLKLNSKTKKLINCVETMLPRDA